MNIIELKGVLKKQENKVSQEFTILFHINDKISPAGKKEKVIGSFEIKVVKIENELPSLQKTLITNSLALPEGV